MALLFLANLKLNTILVSKLVANSMRNAWALLGTLPIMGLCLLLGGVSGLTFAQGVLAVLAASWLSLMIGLEQSCRNQGEHEAFSRGLRRLILLNLIPFVSPASLVLSASSVGSPFLTGDHWVTLGGTVFAGFQFWSLAKSNLANNWQERQAEGADDCGQPVPCASCEGALSSGHPGVAEIRRRHTGFSRAMAMRARSLRKPSGSSFTVTAASVSWLAVLTDRPDSARGPTSS